MNWRERLRNPFVQQYLVEILFPLIGYLFFDWSLTIIAVFYLMDQLAAESAFMRRFYRVAQAKNSSVTTTLFLYGALFLGFLLTELALVMWYLPPVQQAGMQWQVELVKFAKEELWFLFPLVVLMYHLKDQFLFYMPRRHLLHSPSRMIRYRLATNAALVVLLLAGLAIWNRFPMPEVVVLAIFLVLKITFDLTLARWANEQSKSQ